MYHILTDSSVSLLAGRLAAKASTKPAAPTCALAPFSFGARVRHWRSLALTQEHAGRAPRLQATWRRRSVVVSSQAAVVQCVYSNSPSTAHVSVLLALRVAHESSQDNAAYVWSPCRDTSAALVALDTLPGTPEPLGPSVPADGSPGVNFALFSKHASKVSLCMYAPARTSCNGFRKKWLVEGSLVPPARTVAGGTHKAL